MRNGLIPGASGDQAEHNSSMRIDHHNRVLREITASSCNNNDDSFEKQKSHHAVA
jgi:hypothetical protein